MFGKTSLTSSLCIISSTTVCKTVRLMISVRCLSVCLSICLSCPDCHSVLSVSDVGVLWPNGWIDQYDTWHGDGIGPGHSVLDGDPAPPPERGTDPQFSAHACCGQTAGWIKMPPGTKVGVGTCNIVLDGNPAPPKKAHSPPPSLRLMFVVAKWLG